ncbi:AAA family ATPase [Chitinibacter tainanensis]|uniref:AAA family ATPase n=1 Tax=Chitinibacter tainanensis TaxID=230667 RepID=UPI0023566190|nr:AAA family ATPase [Chitinibacter tainanensis]
MSLVHAAPVQLSLLGRCRLAAPGQPAQDPFPYDKVRALLAYLLLERERSHPREALAELLWPQVSAETARNNLRRTLHDLRRVLAPWPALSDGLQINRRELAWASNAAVECDVWRLMQPVLPADLPAAATARLAAPVAPLLAGLVLSDAPEFERWLQIWRQRCWRQRQQVQQQLSDYYLAAGEQSAAIESLLAEVALEPLHERPYPALFTALLAEGRRAEAATLYEQLCLRLQQECGQSPSAELAALYARLSAAPQLAPALALPSAATGPAERRAVYVLAVQIELRPGMAATERLDVLGMLHENLLERLQQQGAYCWPRALGQVLAYWGYPLASEKMHDLALDTALGIRSWLAQQPAWALRQAIHQGWMLSDPRYPWPDASGQISREAEAGVVLAEPGEILLTPQVLAQGEGAYLYSARLSRGGRDFYSLSAALLGLQRQEGPLIGRDIELATLRRHWQSASAGRVNAVLVQGEAGIGKSRLLRALMAEVAQGGGQVRILRCSQELVHAPYHPVIQLLQQQLAALGPASDSAEVQYARLSQWLAPPGSQLQLHLPALGDLLGLLPAPAVPRPALQARREIEAALLALAQMLAQRGPLLLVVEDVHWLDPSTAEVLQKLLMLRKTPILLVLSARPPVTLPFTLPSLTLAPLTAEEALALARQWSPAELSATELTAVLAQAEGVPLFVEEMSKALAQGPRAGLPVSLWGLLASRLEPFAEARQVLQAGAVLGRQFSHAQLQAVWRGEATVLATACQTLVQAGIWLAADGQYRFHHALLRDAAYQMLPPLEAQHWHLRVAQALAAQPLRRVAQWEQLAQHQLAAGQKLAAAEGFLRAGRLAAEQSANQEAVALLRAGLAAVADWAAPSAQLVQINLIAALASILQTLQGYGSEEAKSYYAQAYTLINQLDAQEALFPVVWGLWLGGRASAPGAAPLELAHKLAEIAALSDDPAQTMQVHYAYGNNYFWLGRYAEAAEHLQAALAIGEDLSPFALINRFGEDTNISARAFLAWVYWFQGDASAAEGCMQQALREAAELQHAHTQCFALTFAAMLQRFAQAPAATEALCAELMALAQPQGLSLWLAAGFALQGWARAMQGDAAALEQVALSLAEARKAMSGIEPTFAGFLIEALLHAGAERAAELELQRWMALAGQLQDVYYLPEAWRWQAQLHQRRGDTVAAKAAMRQALAVAAGQGSVALLQRAQQQAQEWGWAELVAESRTPAG